MNNNNGMKQHVATIADDEVFSGVIKSLNNSLVNVEDMLILVEQAEKILAKMKTATITTREMVDTGKLEDAVEYATKNASGVEEYAEVVSKIMHLSISELQGF